VYYYKGVWWYSQANYEKKRTTVFGGSWRLFAADEVVLDLVWFLYVLVDVFVESLSACPAFKVI
jgi:hypothetical protein